MSFEPVDFFVKDSTPLATPIEGVLVKVYNSFGSVFYTQAVTDVLGQASFLLETLSYSARFYKYQVGFTQPQLFDVLAAPAVNKFDTVGDVFIPPIATDPRFCRASGFFRTVSGVPHRALDMHFQSKFDPVLVEGAGILRTKDAIRTDDDGYAVIDLVRGGEYFVLAEGLEECPRLVKVPDAASTNLPDLLFPVVQAISLTPAGPYSLAVGGTLDVVPVVVDSSGRPLDPATAIQDVIWSVDDAAIVGLTVESSKLVLRGIAAGTANLTAKRLDQTIIRVPNTPITGQPVAITVT